MIPTDDEQSFLECLASARRDPVRREALRRELLARPDARRVWLRAAAFDRLLWQLVAERARG